jgi:predicted nucleic acid-binding protein
MIILDSNVISALMRPHPDEPVLKWLNHRPLNSLWTTSLTIFEIQFGLNIMPAEGRKSSLLEELEFFLARIEHRVVPFDEPAAHFAAELMALRQKKGRVIDLRDIMIAGIVLAHHASLATRNTSHFTDIDATVVDPWTA